MKGDGGDNSNSDGDGEFCDPSKYQVHSLVMMLEMNQLYRIVINEKIMTGEVWSWKHILRYVFFINKSSFWNLISDNKINDDNRDIILSTESVISGVWELMSALLYLL